MPAVQGIEQISRDGRVLAIIIQSDADSDRTAFMTEEQATFQAGFVAYPAGGSVAAHLHLPVHRDVIGTSEFLLVRKGRCFVDIYGDERELVASRELRAGDAVISVGGGHGFRMIEDTVLLEIKQGPYTGVAEKERFDAPPPTGSS